MEEPDHRHRWLLRMRRKRPGCRRATEPCDELAPSHDQQFPTRPVGGYTELWQLDRSGDLERAGRLIAYAQGLFEESGSIPDPDDRVELDEAVARLRDQLGDRYEAVATEGRALSPDEAGVLAAAE